MPVTSPFANMQPQTGLNNLIGIEAQARHAANRSAAARLEEAVRLGVQQRMQTAQMVNQIRAQSLATQQDNAQNVYKTLMGGIQQQFAQREAAQQAQIQRQFESQQLQAQLQNAAQISAERNKAGITEAGIRAAGGAADNPLRGALSDPDSAAKMNQLLMDNPSLADALGVSRGTLPAKPEGLMSGAAKELRRTFQVNVTKNPANVESLTRTFINDVKLLYRFLPENEQKEIDAIEVKLPPLPEGETEKPWWQQILARIAGPEWPGSSSPILQPMSGFEAAREAEPFIPAGDFNKP